MDRHDPNYVEDNAGFTTLPPEQWPDGVLPEGLTYVTTDEMGYLRALSWGDGAHRATCENCGNVMIFEKHPADWPNHPGAPGDVRVKVECNACARQQYTDGRTEVEYVAERTRELYAEIAAEVAARLQAENGGAPVPVENVTAGDVGTSDEAAG